ncbi:acetyltransferase, putative, partial [Stigmatella aurantiaca]
MKLRQVSVLGLAALPFLAGCGSSIEDDIQGKWVSTTCEVRPGPENSKLYVKREYNIKESSWSGTL